MFNIIKSEDENAPLLTVYSIFTLAVYGLFALFWVFPLSKVSAPRVFLYFHDFLVVFCLFLSAHLIFPALFMPY